MTLLQLIAATYFMVSGGPYGLEELMSSAGYSGALLILLVTPIIWSLPTALMVGELSSAIPEEGGYYAWVKRALGPFWGFQEAWLSLMASVFDMAIYPTIFVLYIGRLIPSVATGSSATLLGIVMIAACAAWNVRGARAVGGASEAMTVALLGPFVVLIVCAFLFPPSSDAATSAALAPRPIDWLGGIMIAMWNYMGWDNASTIAHEVDRPQRTYPLAMMGAVLLVAFTYMAPIGALSWTGIDPRGFDTGAWVDVGERIGGKGLAVAIALGGAVCGAGMFNALVMSYSRVPLALADDGLFPKWIGRRHPKTGAPWVAITMCAVAYVFCLGLGFKRLIEIDVLLYGMSLSLEFVALIALRIREPNLLRPFKIPGGTVGAVLISVGPMAILVVALVRSFSATDDVLRTLLIGLAVILGGPLVYFLRTRWR